MCQLNGANSKMLHGQNHPSRGPPYVMFLRIEMYSALRAGTGRITYQAVEEQRCLGIPGNILMDAPPYTTLEEELAVKARDINMWKRLVTSIP